MYSVHVPNNIHNDLINHLVLYGMGATEHLKMSFSK